MRGSMFSSQLSLLEENTSTRLIGPSGETFWQGISGSYRDPFWHGPLHLERKRKKGGIANPKLDFVFCRIDGTPLKAFRNSWRRALEIAGIKDFHFHDLRHTYCSNLLLAGSNLKDVKEMIGHRDISMTDRCSHLSFEHKHLQQVRLSQHFTMNWVGYI